ncbi:DUF4307 domain-containing protein [Streptomyces sp. UH6]|uniref:DUF4307 domain-containing protein n=1 Tax=Streptomyces sp. UH6 TaxID=2748379 RepID=UPI0015D51BC2|nr:DUF4307 domain-containing protein [Streptomyces sp. UH6]NYV74318.1 DUF4307 domain-containing protein [Streptomyces sp. UH6]
MSTANTQPTGQQPPAGRYGRAADAAGDRGSDRTLKAVGAVLGVLLVAVVAWFGFHHVGGSEISGQLITFRTADDSVRVELEVFKDDGVTGYCTVRSQAESGAEVGRADFRFDEDSTRVLKTVTLRTTSRGTTAELLGCHTG